MIELFQALQGGEVINYIVTVTLCVTRADETHSDYRQEDCVDIHDTNEKV